MIGSCRVGAALALLCALAPSSLAAQSFSGPGTMATAPFVLPEGPVRFELEPPAAGPFAAFLLDDRGDVIAQIAGGASSGAAASTVRIPRTARYLIDVRADGPWTIRVSDTPGMADATAAASGALDGRAAAPTGGAAKWLGIGLLSGVTLGPIGTILSVSRAGSGDFAVPAAQRAAIEARGPSYAMAYEEAYRAKLRNGRRTSALVGGLTGSAILAFVLLQMTVFDDDSSGSFEPRPPPDQTIRIPLLQLPIGR